MPDDTEILDTSAETAPVEQDTPQAEPQAEVDTDAAAEIDSTESTDAGDTDTSSTTDSAVADEKPQAASQAIEERYKELQREFTRRSQELKKYRESLGDMDPAEVAARIRAQQEQQTASNLPPWNPQSPHHQRFSSALNNYQLFRQQVSKVPEDQRQAVADAWRDAFTDEDLRAIKAFEQFQSEEQRRIVSDPSYLTAKIREEASQLMRQEMAQQQAVSQWQTFFSSPDVAPLVQKHGRALHALMQGGMPATEAVDYIRSLDREVATAKAQSDRKVAAAEAQRALAKGQASVSRDKAGQPASDPLTAARRLLKQRGVAESAQSLSMALMEVTSSD